jgi:hypothetical protein
MLQQPPSNQIKSPQTLQQRNYHMQDSHKDRQSERIGTIIIIMMMMIIKTKYTTTALLQQQANNWKKAHAHQMI